MTEDAATEDAATRPSKDPGSADPNDAIGKASATRLAWSLRLLIVFASLIELAAMTGAATLKIPLLDLQLPLRLAGIVYIAAYFVQTVELVSVLDRMRATKKSHGLAILFPSIGTAVMVALVEVWLLWATTDAFGMHGLSAGLLRGAMVLVFLTRLLSIYITVRELVPASEYRRPEFLFVFRSELRPHAVLMALGAGAIFAVWTETANWVGERRNARLDAEVQELTDALEVLAARIEQLDCAEPATASGDKPETATPDPAGGSSINEGSGVDGTEAPGSGIPDASGPDSDVPSDSGPPGGGRSNSDPSEQK